jgi:hypothetical protein
MTGSAFASPGLSIVWWAPQTAGGSTADATDCLARFRASWNSFVSFFTNACTLTFDPICLAVEATTGVLQGTFVGTQPASVTGGVSADGLPRQTQGLIRFGTSAVIGGRRLRGRLFLPCPAEADNTAVGAPSSTYTSTATSSFASLLTVGSTTSLPVVWHRPKLGSGGASSLVTSVSCSNQWAVLRSRRS